ncbi:unnamed protein product [Clonostachys solani]|uniref:Uncharacterized protein n=1 Tax=Clonostachys solani TaxID=160281 RepID=A0A9N9YXQ4_9HYPO|nr:unnamed protein product [Clonostachys solani]
MAETAIILDADADHPRPPRKAHKRREKNQSSRRRIRPSRLLHNEIAPAPALPPHMARVMPLRWPDNKTIPIEIDLSKAPYLYHDVRISPPDPNAFWSLGRTRRVRLFEHLSRVNVTKPTHNILQLLIWGTRERDLATMLIKSLSPIKSLPLKKGPRDLIAELSFKVEYHDLTAELIGLAPPAVLRHLLTVDVKRFFHPRMLVRIIHVAARRITQMRKRVPETEAETLENIKRSTTRLIISLVALILLSYRPPEFPTKNGAIADWATEHIHDLKALAEERNLMDRGVQMGIIFQAIKNLRELLQDQIGGKSKTILLGLRIAIGLLGMVPIVGPVTAGVCPLLEELVGASVEKRKGRVNLVVERINDVCADFEEEAERTIADQKGVELFRKGLKYVETCLV